MVWANHFKIRATPMLYFALIHPLFWLAYQQGDAGGQIMWTTKLSVSALMPNSLASCDLCKKCMLHKLRTFGNCSSVWLRSDLAELEVKSAEGQKWLTSYGQHNQDEERFGFRLLRQRYSRCNWEQTVKMMVTVEKVTDVTPVSPICYTHSSPSDPIMWQQHHNRAVLPLPLV